MPAAPSSGRIAARTRGRHAGIRLLLATGLSVRAISAELGLSRNPVPKFERAADPKELLVRDWSGRRHYLRRTAELRLD